eukprot:TRINITY_DN3634_c0_g1_i2.p1 TRINITY_DN3634_c0_g1~~TRINITY_DN3634_c0_g1_i2.p1  ORF type:complete len:364 (+),score=81.44 TRINITY_DN3634_c0_g1_i2:704-1795(+)
MGLGRAILEAVIVFIGSNVDDLILLTILFAQVNHTTKKNVHVIGGFLLGFSFLVILSLIGIALGEFFPAEYVALLGFLPLINGFIRLVILLRNKWQGKPEDSELSELEEVLSQLEEEKSRKPPHSHSKDVVVAPSLADDSSNPPGPSIVDDSSDAEDIVLNDAPRQPELQAIQEHIAADELQGTQPLEDTQAACGEAKDASFQAEGERSEHSSQQFESVNIDCSDNIQTDGSGSSDDDDDDDQRQRELKNSKVKKLRAAAKDSLSHCVAPFCAETLLCVIADGGDSLTSYLPVYATSTAAEIVVIVIAFYIMVAITLSIAFCVVRAPPIARFMGRFGVWLRPFMLMALGLYILKSSVIFSGGG